MSTFSWEIKGLSEVLDGLTRIGARVAAATPAATLEAAHLVQKAAMAEAPVLTGTLRRSIHTEGPLASVGGAMAQVGPSVIYARRIELGFHGADSLGRHFDQSGDPYLQRGYESTIDQIAEVYARAWAKAVAG